MTAPLPATDTSISKLDYALDARRRGMRIFPMLPDSSVTASAEAYCNPTDDEAKIREWWAADPTHNIGIATVELLVLRTSTAKASAELGQLISVMLGDTPKTTRIIHFVGRKSPGFLIFSLPSGARVAEREILPGVRVLSDDDAILGPGSEINELESIFANERSVAPAPSWLIEMCGVTLPESNLMNTNVVSMPRQTAAEIASKTQVERAKDAAARLHMSVFPVHAYEDPGPDATPEQRLVAAKKAKTPLIKDWQNQASQDPAKIEEMWRQYPNANIGGVTRDHIVVDLDPRNGGEETMAALLAVEHFPDTAATRTQSGGRHLIYVAPNGPVKGGTGKLGPGVDIKARGGYVLLPGSTIEGRPYEFEISRPPAFAPQWIVDRCAAAKDRTDTAGKRVVEEDDTAREMFVAWIREHAPCAELGEIDDRTFLVSARGYDFGCSESTVLELVHEWNDTHCNGLGDLERLPVVVESAGRNRDKAIGSSHPLAPGFEAVEIDQTMRPGPVARNAAPAPPATGLATPLLQFDPVGLELRPWVIPGFACRGRVTLLAGPGGVAKSTYYLMVAVATVSGRSDICGFPILKRERVWVWNQEDDIAEMQRRVAAIMKEFNVSWDDLKDEDGSPMLYLDSGVDKPLMLANRSAEHSIVPGKQVADVIATAKANRIAVLILDPLVEFHEASENDNVQMRAVVGQVRRIAVEADCATMLSTHTRKPPVASSDGFAGEMDAARGASAQLGVVRIGATIFSMSPKQAKDHRLAEGTTHLDYVRIDIAKNNLAPVLPDPIWFRRVGVRVGGGFEQNGESVGVLRPVTLDKKVATSSSMHLPSLLAEIIATKLSWEKHFKVSEVLACATPAQQALFGDKKNRARCIADAFDGADACPTEAGILTKTSARGKEMTLHLRRTSSLPQPPKKGGRGSENDDDTET
ncbi:MAG: bifunctional DNA primase/polymerase [Rhizobiales bacterium]|nr:bifunctional DNA primase/polymerase [Hyphomicrobiales bacterium]